MRKKKSDDLEKEFLRKQFIEKLSRLIHALETNEPYSIQIKNERIRVPANAKVSIEYEKGGAEEELEFQLKWTRIRNK